MGHLTNYLRRTAKPLFALGCTVVVFALLGSLAEAAPAVIDVYFPPAPPLSMEPADGRNGIVGEVVLKAAALAGYNLRLNPLPWNRAQRVVQTGTDLLILPLSRTPDREDSYTWIAPIMTMDRAFFSLDKRVETFAQARRTYRRVAVGMGSAQEQKLRDEGFSKDQIYSLKIGENPAKMLLLGRVDAWFNGVPESRYIWPEVSTRPLLMSPPLMTADLYLACSKSCNPILVDKLRKAVETLREDGTIKRTISAYLDPGPRTGAAGAAPQP